MQGRHALVLVVIFALSVSGCKEPNPFYCPPGRACEPVVIPCDSSGECEAPTPVCKTEAMVCVECMENSHCRAEAPICDSQANKCVQCTKNADCESAICLEDQTCADPAEVLHVSANGGDNTTCSKATPCKLLGQALASTSLRKYIKVTGTITHDAETVIDANMLGGKAIIVYGDPGASALTRSTDDTVLSIRRAANVTFVGLEIKAGALNGNGVQLRDSPGPTVTMIDSKVSGHSGTGITVSTGSLTLIRSQVSDNRTFGIEVTGGSLSLQGSWVLNNSGNTAVRVSGAMMVSIDSSVIAGNKGTAGGLDIASPFTIKNTVIASNGDANAGTVGGALLRASSGTFLFNTVTRNVAGGGVGAISGIACGSGSRVLSNSILVNNTIDLVSCTGVTYSLTDGGSPAGMNNATGDPKFMNTTNPLDPTYYRIQGDSAAKDKADATAPVEVDIDGEPRDDGQKDIGADEYKVR